MKTALEGSRKYRLPCYFCLLQEMLIRVQVHPPGINYYGRWNKREQWADAFHGPVRSRLNCQGAKVTVSVIGKLIVAREGYT